MPTVRLSDRALIAVSGPDAEHFLQNLITTDLDALAADVVKPGALLTPQGKILFDFLVSRAGPGALRIDVRADVADDLVRRLTMYRLRAKVELSKQDQALVAARWDADSDASRGDSSSSETDSTAFGDTRFPDRKAERIYGPVANDAELSDWTRLRIAHGVAESGSDYALGDAFPHDVLLDQNAGVGFRKGCYVGQEVVSRMQHRGTARRRVLIASADADLPVSGTPVNAGGRPVGTLGTVSGRDGLALMRIDKVADAIRSGTPVLAGDVALRLTIPVWAGFTFPEAPAAPDDA